MKPCNLPKKWQNLLHEIESENKEFNSISSPDFLLQKILEKKPPQCPHCGEKEELGFHGPCPKKQQRYYCKICTKKNNGKRRTFLSSNGSVVHYLHKKKEFVLQAKLMHDNESITIKEVAKECEIAITTAFTFRHKIGAGLGKYFEGKKDTAPVQSGTLQMDYMEKGGSSRKKDKKLAIKEIAGYELLSGKEDKSVTGNSNSKDGIKRRFRKFKKKKKQRRQIVLEETFSLVYLKLSNNGKLSIDFNKGRGKLKRLVQSLENDYKINLSAKLKAFFNGHFRGVSTRYIVTYTCWYELRNLKLTFLELLTEIISERDAKPEYFRNNREEIWDLPTVRLPSIAA